MTSELLTLFCTCPDAACAEGIAKTLVEERLAACVNLVPGLHSFYRWEDRVRDDSEVLLIVKTARERFKAVEARIGELHPYELPELVAVPITTGNARYLAWLRNESSSIS
ncbi:MAG TPA: divalent-cation tolerance protein CutA [Gammaproteobacteria bacterium]|nr:divalent-cation tolerance protein CutA [Gammaproteobacteria bacterium]